MRVGFFFFHAVEGIQVGHVTGVRRVLFRSCCFFVLVFFFVVVCFWFLSVFFACSCVVFSLGERKSVVSVKSVVLCGRRIIKKKNPLVSKALRYNHSFLPIQHNITIPAEFS